MEATKPAREMYSQYVQAIVSGEIAQNLNVDRAIHAWSNFDSVFLGLAGRMLSIKGDLTDFKSILQVFTSYESSYDLSEILFDLLFEAQQNSADAEERFEKEVEAQEAAWARLEPMQKRILLGELSYSSYESMRALYRALFNCGILRHFKALCDTYVLADNLQEVLSSSINANIIAEAASVARNLRHSMGNIPRD